MSASEIVRRLRGAVRNGAVWGLGWFVLALLVAAVVIVSGNAPAGIGWMDGVGVAIKVGVVGGVAGAAFALAIALLYRGRRISTISVWRFGLGGGILTGLFIPLFLETMNVLTGGSVVPLRLVVGDAVTGLVLGTILAAASLWLAQRAEAPGSSDGMDGIDAGAEVDALPAGDPFGHASRRRAKETVDDGR